MSNSNPEFMIDSFVGEYDFLSNFAPCEVEYAGVKYPSTEHAFQAAKSPEEAKSIDWNGISAGKAKRVGKTLTLRADWESVKLGIMYDLLFQKFQNPELKLKLINTGSRLLVEGNTWGDTFWGVCKGVGKNHLGKLLMQVREDIKDAKMVEE